MKTKLLRKVRRNYQIVFHESQDDFETDCYIVLYRGKPITNICSQDKSEAIDLMFSDLKFRYYPWSGVTRDYDRRNRKLARGSKVWP